MFHYNFLQKCLSLLWEYKYSDYGAAFKAVWNIWNMNKKTLTFNTIAVV